MTNQDRFNELVTTIDMLPDVDSWEELQFTPEDLVFPNGTDGLTTNMCMALLCHASKQEQDWRNMLYTVLWNSSALNMQNENTMTTYDLNAIALCTNIGFITGSLYPMLKAISYMFNALEHTQIEEGGINVPPLVASIYKDYEDIAQKFQSTSPYDFLSEE